MPSPCNSAVHFVASPSGPGLCGLLLEVARADKYTRFVGLRSLSKLRIASACGTELEYLFDAWCIHHPGEVGSQEDSPFLCRSFQRKSRILNQHVVEESRECTRDPKPALSFLVTSAQVIQVTNTCKVVLFLLDVAAQARKGLSSAKSFQHC